MRSRFLALAFISLALTAQAQDPPILAVALGFEASPIGTCPGSWRCSVPETIAADSQVVHGGRWSARIERQPGSPEQFSTLTKSIPLDFAGKRLELRGFIRSERVQGFTAFWMREDGPTGSVEFATMQGRQVVDGTTPWTEYSISLPVNSAGRSVYFGFLLSGTGKAWADDLQLLVDGEPVWAAPLADHPKTVFDVDPEFDGGSRIALEALNPVQVENLATLGKLWGFLKYHHPQVTAGVRHFDYDLLRVLPTVLAAHDRQTANGALLRWVEGLGALPPCTACATLTDATLYFRPDLDWITDEDALGPGLSRRLRDIRDRRPAAPKQFYVGLAPGVGNPIFHNEPSYAIRFPDAGFQMLALFRYWNIIEYWYPYRDLIGDKAWNATLREFLPLIALATDRDSYQREMMALVARVQDTHANLWSSLGVRPPVGACQVPVDVRFTTVLATHSSYCRLTSRI